MAIMVWHKVTIICIRAFYVGEGTFPDEYHENKLTMSFQNSATAHRHLRSTLLADKILNCHLQNHKQPPPWGPTTATTCASNNAAPSISKLEHMSRSTVGREPTSMLRRPSSTSIQNAPPILRCLCYDSSTAGFGHWIDWRALTAAGSAQGRKMLDYLWVKEMNTWVHMQFQPIRGTTPLHKIQEPP